MCIRILFGNSENYNDKFRTCARARPFNSQRLGNDFYVKESTKPLFNKHELLAVENLYRYRCLMELFTIVKSRTPVSSQLKMGYFKHPFCEFSHGSNASRDVLRSKNVWLRLRRASSGWGARPQTP